MNNIETSIAAAEDLNLLIVQRCLLLKIMTLFINNNIAKNVSNYQKIYLLWMLLWRKPNKLLAAILLQMFKILILLLQLIRIFKLEGNNCNRINNFTFILKRIHKYACMIQSRKLQILNSVVQIVKKVQHKYWHRVLK